MGPEDWKRIREKRAAMQPDERKIAALEDIADELMRLRDQMTRIEVALATPRR